MPRLQVALSLSLLGCAATEGPLLLDTRGEADAAVELDGSGGGATVTQGPVQPGMRLQYQLSGALDGSVDADFFVVDLFNTTAAEVARLHTRGRVVAAYVSAGTREPGRSDNDEFPPAAVGNPLASYPRESWLDVRDPTVRQIMQARLDRARDKGFDGVLLSSLSAYQADSGHDLTAADQLDYNLWLADEAHAAGLSAGLAGDWAHAEQLAPRYDFAISVDCVSAGRCQVLDPYLALGKPVFVLETGDSSDELCTEAARLGLPVTFKRDNFDAWLQLCP